MNAVFNKSMTQNKQVGGCKRTLNKKGLTGGTLLPPVQISTPMNSFGGSLKQYLPTHVKPKQLKVGVPRILANSHPPAVCRKYISHLMKVIPKVTEEDGGPFGN